MSEEKDFRYRRKQYVHSNVKVPRSTDYARRKRAEKAMAKLRAELDASGIMHVATAPSLSAVVIPDVQSLVTDDIQENISQTEITTNDEALCHNVNDVNRVPTDGEHNIFCTSDKDSSNFIHSGSNETMGNATNNDQVMSEKDTFPVSSEARTDQPLNVDRSQCSGGDILSDCVHTDDVNMVGSFKNPNFASSEKLCPCSPLTVNDVSLMVFAIGLRHSLTWEAMLDIFRLVNAIFDANKISPSRYLYLKRLQEERKDMQYQIYCPSCQKYIGASIGNKGCVLCTTCEKDINVAKVENFFLSVSIESQLRKLLQIKDVADYLLSYRFDRKKINSQALEDIIDGSEYRKHSENGGILSFSENFSYTFFTDGVSMGKTTNKSMWPIYLTINELPPIYRRKYIILAGLHVGPHDPDHTVFLKPFVQNANKLSTEGFTWEYKGKKITSKVIPLVAVLDSVARYQVMNYQSFHAKQGCTYCYTKQTHTRKGLKYTVDPHKTIQQRTYESLEEDLRGVFDRRFEIREEKRAFRGVKALSSLINLKYFDFFSGFVVDYLHAVLVGAADHHTELLLSSACKSFWNDLNEDHVGMEHLIAAIDKRLTQIKPPTCITRTPRPISVRKLWRANEWRSFLLFYSIPSYSGLLKDKYLLHWCMLSKAMNILLQKSITKEEVLEAHRLLECYVFYFQLYYGEEEMKYNIHLLTHLAKCVLDWGPLAVTSAFLFESQNRFLLKLRKSANQVALQIVRKYLLFFSFPLLSEKLLTTNVSIEFCEDVLDRKLKIFVSCGETLLLGRGTIWNPSKWEEDCVYRFCSYKQFSCLSYQKLMYKRKKISTSDYHKGKKNNNSCLLLTDDRLAVVRYILQVPNKRIVMLVQEIQLHPTPLLENNLVKLEHISPLRAFGEAFCIDPSSIKEYAIYVQIDSSEFISTMPFGCYGD